MPRIEIGFLKNEKKRKKKEEQNTGEKEKEKERNTSIERCLLIKLN